MNLIMGHVIPDQSVLSALEIENLNFNSLFRIYPHCKPVLLSTQVRNIGPSWSSCLYRGWTGPFFGKRERLFL